MAKLSRAKSFEKEADRAAEQERAIQRKIDRSDRTAKREGDEKGAMQAGARTYPVPPLPGQHLSKPGVEADLELKPMYDAPYYKGSDKLLDKVALSPAVIPESAAPLPCSLLARAPTWP